MDYAQRISSMVLSLRKKERLRVRQPLKRILLPVLDENFQSSVEAVEELIKAEVNIKGIEYVFDTTGIVNKKAKPNFKTLGRGMGKDMKTASGLIMAMDQEAIQAFETNKTFTITIDGTDHELGEEDIEIMSEDIPGWQVINDGPLVVALDTTLDDDLIKEGTARELVNRIQNLRKQKDFNVTDRIKVVMTGEDRIKAAVEAYGEYIKSEVLADEVVLSNNGGGESFEIYDDLTINIDVEKN